MPPKTPPQKSEYELRAEITHELEAKRREHLAHEKARLEQEKERAAWAKVQEDEREAKRRKEVEDYRANEEADAQRLRQRVVEFANTLRACGVSVYEGTVPGFPTQITLHLKTDIDSPFI